MTSLEKILQKNQSDFASIVSFNLLKDNVLEIDLTEANQDLKTFDLRDSKIFDEYVSRKIQEANAVCAIGGYLENRYIYRRSEHFQQGNEPRSIHLGVDIWATAGTSVYAPMAGKVHSFQNNDNFGDYGPTIILEHQIEGIAFYTLYGHLNLECLEGLLEGKNVAKGEKIAEFGNYPINGDWASHLHFQVITDMLGKKGDFIGVCEPSQKEYYSKICINPMSVINYQ